MSKSHPGELQPVTALRQAALERIVAFLRLHRIARLLVGVIGAVLLIVGATGAPFREIPLFSWLLIGPVAAICLAGGLGALGVWYLSRPTGSMPAAPSPQEDSDSPPSAELVRQLDHLRDLHVAGDLTDMEYSQAKARLLK